MQRGGVYRDQRRGEHIACRCTKRRIACQRTLIANNAGLSDEGSRNEVRQRERHAGDAAAGGSRAIGMMSVNLFTGAHSQPAAVVSLDQVRVGLLR